MNEKEIKDGLSFQIRTLHLQKEQVMRMPLKIKKLFKKHHMLDVEDFNHAVEALTPEERQQLNNAICYKKGE